MLAVVVLSLGLLVAPLAFGALVRAQTTDGLSDSEIELIRLNCQSSKNTLNQLHASDALLRVNRGQVYESILTRLMERFSDRLDSNGLDNKATTTVASSYSRELDKFRTDYKAYEEQLSLAIKIDCQQNPEDYHYAIEDAREKRNVVHQDVENLHRYMDDYEQAVKDFLLDYKDSMGDE